MSLARRSITSTVWNVFSGSAGLGILFLRSVYLARILPVDLFGVYAFASSIIRFVVVFPDFGMSGAFLHRTSETEDAEQAAAVQFTLKLILTTIWAATLIPVAILYTTGPLRLALIVLTLATAGIQITQTPRLILIRNVDHRRLAVLNVLNSILTTVVAIALALKGFGIWALLATDLASFVLNFVSLYVWRPVWRPKLMWSPVIVRYFLRFGSRGFLADLLHRALDRLDDLWTGFYLGNTALGFYSRAYTFATYPRKLLASPINNVAGGTYAELKYDRHRLSQAFFRTNSLLVRTGFFLAGLLSLIAPELIRILLTPKWLPMLDAFRLMLIFTLFDPIKLTIAKLFIAVGKPEQIVRARAIQMIFLVIGLFAFGFRFNIMGVAIAVDIMLVVGIVLLLRWAKEYVDFSARQMFFVPVISLLIGLIIGRLAIEIPGVLGNPWKTGLVKATVFSGIYIGILLILELKQTLKMLDVLQRLKSRDIRKPESQRY